MITSQQKIYIHLSNQHKLFCSPSYEWKETIIKANKSKFLEIGGHQLVASGKSLPMYTKSPITNYQFQLKIINDQWINGYKTMGCEWKTAGADWLLIDEPHLHIITHILIINCLKLTNMKQMFKKLYHIHIKISIFATDFPNPLLDICTLQ